MKRVIRLIIFMFLFACMADKAGCQVDSVMGIIRSLPPGAVRLHELEKWMNKTMDTPDELIILDTLLSEATRFKHIDYQAIVYRNRVRYYFNANNLEKTKVEIEPAIAFFRKHKIYSLLFDVQSMLITLYTNRQEYEFSLLKGKEMYKEAEVLNNKEGKVSACYVLSYACYVSGRTREALKWNQKGIALVGNGGSRQSLMELYFLQVECALKLSKPEELKSYLDLVHMLLVADEKDDPDNISHDYSYYWLWLNSRYAYYFLNNHDLSLAEWYLKEASKYIDERSYYIYQDLYHYTWSDYYLALGQYDKAQNELEKGYAFIHKQYAGDDVEVLQKKARIDYRRGDYSLAAEEIQRSIQISDSLNNIRFINQSQQLRTIYDMNRLEAEAEETTFVVCIQIVITLFLCGSLFALCIFFFRFRKMRHQLATAAENAQIADRNTSLFLNNMGREVKDFLEEMSNLSDQLIEATEEKRQEYATAICSRNERAQKVIFDILDFSKIESGRMQFHFETIGLSGFMKIVQFSLREYIPKNVEVNYGSSESILFVTDSFRFNQLLISLLRYAVTHTSPGVIYFCCEMKEQEILFRIFGKEWAMSSEEYESLFDRIQQSSGRLEDMDLGMIISRGLIQALGGILKVYPEPEGGTRFEFAIPKRSLPENG